MNLVLTTRDGRADPVGVRLDPTEIADADLDQVVGGLERVWIPVAGGPGPLGASTADGLLPAGER